MNINKSEFTDFYYNDLHDILTAREALRLKDKTNFSIARGLIVSFATLMSILFLGTSWAFIALVIIFIISCSLFFVTYIKSFETSAQGFEQEVITPLVKFISSDLDYNAEGYVDYNLFTYSSLFHDVTNLYKGKKYVRKFYEDKKYINNVYEGKNYMYGYLNKLKFECSEIRARINYEYTFYGIFFIIALPKPSSTTTLIYPKLIDEQHSPTYLNYQRARLEDPEFERSFDAYTDDQVGARGHLTPTMMENILKLVDFLPAKPFLSFRGERLHIAIPSPSRLRAPLSQSVFDSMIVDRFFEELNMIVTIPEILGLTNTSTSAR